MEENPKKDPPTSNLHVARVPFCVNDIQETHVRVAGGEEGSELGGVRWGG